MSFLRLLLHNLLYHRRGNFAVFLGVALGTAVLTGALLVGDSLKGSLTDLTLDQLGWVENAVTANRFFHDKLITDAGVQRGCSALMLRGSAVSKSGAATQRVNKVNVLGVDSRFWPQDSVPSARQGWTWGKDETPRIGIPLDRNFWDGKNPQVVVNQALADSLQVSKGNTIYLQLQKTENVPREFMLGKRRSEDVVEAIGVDVAEILPDRSMASFTLTPSPEPVRNAFVPLKFLQEKLNLKDEANEGEANVLFSAGPRATPSLADRLNLADWGVVIRDPLERADALLRFLDNNNNFRNPGDQDLTKGHWKGQVPDALAKLADKSGVLKRAALQQYYRRNVMVESKQMLLEDALAEAVERACGPRTEPHIFMVRDARWWICPLFVYLADGISDGKREAAYVIVAGRGPLPDDMDVPTGDQIDLARWQGSPLNGLKPGDPVTVTYYAPDDHNQLRPIAKRFTFRKYFDLTGPFDDPDLVPVFPGITNKRDLSDWNEEELPFPFKRKRTTAADDSYWKRYRTTPRAYVSLEMAQKLWGSRFGKLTSFLLRPVDKIGVKTLDDGRDLIRSNIRRELARHPEAGGFVWQNVRQQGEKAGGGSTDFGMYFLAFSFFLIAAALLLVGLLFRLNLDLRGREIGILLATGWAFAKVRWLLLCEGLALAIGGAFAGLLGSLLYADLMLRYLAENWPGQQLSFLRLHPTSQSLAIGWSASVLVSFLTILWAVRILGRMTPVRLLAGDTTASVGVGAAPPGEPNRVSGGSVSPDRSRGSARRTGLLLAICALAAGGLLVGGVIARGGEAQAGCFFGSGFSVLALGLILMWHRLRSSAGGSHPRQGLAGLAVRNAGRHAVRSVLTIGLLASATFLIVAVGLFHKDAGAEFLQKTGGSGGFEIYAQADVPIFEDLNDLSVRRKIAAKRVLAPPLKDDAARIDFVYLLVLGRLPSEGERALARAGLAAEGQTDERKWERLVQASFERGQGSNVTFYPCRLQAGDEASCLNLYQPQMKPRILGVPRRLIDRGGFSFAQTLAQTDDEKKNPWLLLTKGGAGTGATGVPPMDANDAGLPAFVDANSAQYILHKSLGDVYEVANDQGQPVKLRIVGLFHESVFQSEIVVSDADFRRLYPRQEGFSFFLVDGPKADMDRIKNAWGSALSDHGLIFETTTSRLEKYLSVENTYLATFQALGGLGLLLGAAGLAIVLLRSVWERRGELALLRALGFRRAALGWLVLAENAFLLLTGLLIGLASALLAVAPHLAGGEAHLFDLRVVGLLALVAAAGLAAGSAAVFTTLRAPLLAALRHE